MQNSLLFEGPCDMHLPAPRRKDPRESKAVVTMSFMPRKSHMLYLTSAVF